MQQPRTCILLFLTCFSSVALGGPKQQRGYSIYCERGPYWISAASSSQDILPYLLSWGATDDIEGTDSIIRISSKAPSFAPNEWLGLSKKLRINWSNQDGTDGIGQLIDRKSLKTDKVYEKLKCMRDSG
jgi:hypothetical protein